VLGRVGQGWRGVARSMPCKLVCGWGGEHACTSGNAMHALGIHGACTAWSERGPWRRLRAVWSAAAGWATWAVSLGVLWCDGSGWLAVEALVSNGRAPVGFGEREREW
jgi:hypothetical protein